LPAKLSFVGGGLAGPAAGETQGVSRNQLSRLEDIVEDEVRLNITLQVDDEGMLGRQCHNCSQYFKLKLGTGIQDITTTTCPYCEFQSDCEDFATDDQIEYAQSIAIQQLVEPTLRDFQKSLKKLERQSKGSLIQFKAIGTNIRFPIKYYKEKDLETIVECDNCGLLFAIYGVFASCPDCLRLNSMSMFKKSLEAVRKRLSIIDKIPQSEDELHQGLIADAISAGVATFDSLGKRMRKEFPEIFPPRPRNIFQNLIVLSDVLQDKLNFEVREYLGTDRFNQLLYMFHVRHIWIHNFGEADNEFIEKTNTDQSLIGSKIVPAKEDVLFFLDLVEELGVEIRSRLGNSG